MKAANYAPTYCAIYPALAEIARTHGYALAIHGSLGRDFDLTCIPWADTPAEPEKVVNAMLAEFAFKLAGGPPSLKAHGRIVYTLAFFAEWAVDLSFMPYAAPPPAAVADTP